MLHLPFPLTSVLCVTKQRELGNALGEALTSFSVTFAANAYEAIALSNSRLFDAFVFDFWLEDWSGVQLCRHIRKDDPYVPVLIFNAADQDEARKRAIRFGANAVFTAPMDAEALRSSLDRLIHLGDSQSLLAKTAANHAIDEELVRQSKLLRDRAQDARQTAVQANERIVRAKGLKAFIEKGGTRSQFDRWWPDVYADYMQRL